VGFGRDFRLRTVNGKHAPLAEHLAVLPVVAWATGDAEMLSGPPALRRRFLDRGVVGMRPASLEVLGRYRQGLRQKRELLASGGTGLEAWNGVLAEAAAELIGRRYSYVEALKTRLAEVIEESGLPFPQIGLTYRPSPAGGLESAAAVAESLERISDRERQRQMPLLGPHRDDLEITWEGRVFHRVASAGERKSLSLLLLAAHGRVLAAHGRSPVHLLDDADAELSPHTLAAVWKVFAGVQQLFATSNRPQVWLTLPIGSLWQVEGGRVSPL
jgi:DNA replication and repair protein RecF